MADRKQGAGLSSGSSEAVHEAIEMYSLAYLNRDPHTPFLTSLGRDRGFNGILPLMQL